VTAGGGERNHKCDSTLDVSIKIEENGEIYQIIIII
jgi:hypothetical protein